MLCYKYIMGKVLEIGISKIKGGKILKVNKVEAVKGKGLVNDRKFRDNNNPLQQVTLIEIENINIYNLENKSSILPLDFRRNIITKNIKLNKLVGKEFFVGKVRVLAHDLCKPCLYLQNLLKQESFVDQLTVSGGLRCEVLSNGIIRINDDIVI
jgi:MOSC domain-containing protein YiiM